MPEITTPANNTAIPFSYVRFLHAAPTLSPVDIYINGELVAKNISYKNFTTYLKAAPGVFNITIMKTGSLGSPLLLTRLRLNKSMIYTVAIIGLPGEYELQLIGDRTRIPRSNMSYMRFIHLSPNSPSVDIYVDGRIKVSDMIYKEVTNYIALTPGKHSIQFRDNSTGKILLDNPSAVLKDSNFYACYLVGDQLIPPGLQMLIPLEGTSYLQP